MSDTIEFRLQWMRAELRQIVSYLNGIGQYDTASHVQASLQSLAYVSDHLAEQGLCDDLFPNEDAS